MITVATHFPCRAIGITRREAERCATYVLTREKRKNATVTLVFTDDRTIRAINKKHLGHDFATDVISFALENAPLEAEVYINLQQARRQASEFSVTPLNEATRLVVHGVLHCCGYDDMTESAKNSMIVRQERHVAALRGK